MSEMSLINEILQIRAAMQRHDTELWTFANREQRNLQNLTDNELQIRLAHLDKNIQFLDSGKTPRDNLPPNRGWISPWWWLRQRHLTILEFQHRELSPAQTPVIAPIPLIAPEFHNSLGGIERLVRVSQEEWLLQLLQGRLRFVEAGFYQEQTLGSARTDNELKKAYRRPGQALRITTQNGAPIIPLGDVETSMHRGTNTPYWFCSFSSELDPRLAAEFEPTLNAAFLIIFDPMAFVRRALPILNRVAPTATKELFPNEYFDPYYPPREMLHPHIHKNFCFAYQREMRMVLDPCGDPPLTNGEALFVEIGSISDIAGVYGLDGHKINGTGPETFWA